MLYHDSHDAQYRDPLGPVAAGNRLTLRFACDESPEVLLRTWDGAERLYPMVSVGRAFMRQPSPYRTSPCFSGMTLSSAAQTATCVTATAAISWAAKARAMTASPTAIR